MVRIEKGGSIPRFRDAELQYVDRQRCSIALVFPEVIHAEIGEYENRGDNSQNSDWPMVPAEGDGVRLFH